MDIIKTFLIIFLCACINLGYTQCYISNLNSNWRFILENQTPFLKGYFIDNSWKSINVSHDWSFNIEVRKRGNGDLGGGYFDGGIDRCRRSFDANKVNLSNITYNNFDGNYTNSELRINCHYLRIQPNGFISFRYDISKYLEATNKIIAESLDNSLERLECRNYPFRNDTPIVLSEVHSMYFKPNSIFLNTPSIQDNKAAFVFNKEINSA